MSSGIIIRNIQPSDNLRLAQIIRASLSEFGAAKPGTVYYDDTTDHLSDIFKEKSSGYFVVTEKEEILGGAGFYPTANLPEATCELVKLYLSPSIRGKGIGKLLIQKCEEAALEYGYKNMYLETMPELKVAVPLYEKLGYQYLDKALGNSGHSGCDIWMWKKLI